MSWFKSGQAVGKGIRNLPSLEAKAGSEGRRCIAEVLMFLASPVMGLFFVVFVPVISLFVALMLLPRIALASDALKSEEAQICMGCHGSPGMVKTFGNKETVSIYLEERDFMGTVHGFLSCTNCHTNVSMDNHPSATYKSRAEFALSVSQSCRMCHADEQIFSKPVHRQAINRPNAPPCSSCHGIHAISKVSALKSQSADNRYCLTCHSKKLSKTINGELLSLSVDESTLKGSVHSNHKCTDCHQSFSKEEHPLQAFKSKREHSIALSSACSGCHEDKSIKMKGSIHAAIRAEGNINAPVCTDCHNFHSVGPKALAGTISGAPCKKCHQEIFGIYKESVHGTAKSRGNNKAPICSTCHFAHDVKATSLAKGMKDTCTGCHTNAADKHSQWLPNTEAHFDSVACAACHVPDADRSVYLYLSDKNTGEAVSEARLGKLAGDVRTSMKKQDMEGKDLWGIYRMMSREDDSIVFTGKMGLRDGKKAHFLALKDRAVKACDKCHSSGSEFFKSVKMAIPKSNGKAEFYSVSPDALNSAFTVLPLGRFYAIGATRLKLLDIFGVLAVLAGASFPAVHIAARILTRPIRKKRKGAHH